MTIKIALLAGEPSGDNLAASLMAALRKQCEPDAQIEFVGDGGPAMVEQGLRSMAAFDTLAVNGFKDPLLRLPQLWRLYRRLAQLFKDEGVDAFVGIDFNVFNFLLEKRLRKFGIPTAHYVSPSVYAWRRGRTKKVAQCADLLFCLYPFEPRFYAGLPLRAVFVGHPLAEAIGLDAGGAMARERSRVQLQIEPQNVVIAVLPGSRASEVAIMLQPFLAALRLLRDRLPQRKISAVIPCVNAARRSQIEALLPQFADLSIKLIDNDARSALIAADAALIKSGTSTLEAMLLGRPMVVSYKLGAFSYAIASRLVNTPYIALPNILAGAELVPELIQEAATPAALAQALMLEIGEQRTANDRRAAFTELHEQLRGGASGLGASAAAAQEIFKLLEARKG